MANNLTTKNAKFKFTPEVDLFVVRQYAEFMTPLKICDNIMSRFSQYCERDIDVYGEEDFVEFLLARVYNLNPKRSNFPQKYREQYEEYKKEYLDNFDTSYLAHRRNRVRELDTLYNNVIARAQAEADPTVFLRHVKEGREIIKEMRVEMDGAKIILQGIVEDGNKRLIAKRSVENLTTEELEAIVEADESDRPIPVDITAKPETDSSDGNGGTGE